MTEKAGGENSLKQEAWQQAGPESLMEFWWKWDQGLVELTKYLVLEFEIKMF